MWSSIIRVARIHRCQTERWSLRQMFKTGHFSRQKIIQISYLPCSEKSLKVEAMPHNIQWTSRHCQRTSSNLHRQYPICCNQKLRWGCTTTASFPSEDSWHAFRDADCINSPSHLLKKSHTPDWGSPPSSPKKSQETDLYLIMNGSQKDGNPSTKT